MCQHRSIIKLTYSGINDSTREAQGLGVEVMMFDYLPMRESERRAAMGVSMLHKEINRRVPILVIAPNTTMPCPFDSGKYARSSM